MTGPWARALILFLIALAIRAPNLDGDPPRWLTGQHSPVIDGPWYLAEVVLPEDPDLPGSYRRPIYREVARAVLRVAGASDATYALPAALAGALLAPVLYLLLRGPAGERVALVAGLLAAVDALHAGWSRTPVPYSLVALAGAFAFGIAARGGTRALLAACLLVVAAAAGLKVVALAALAPVLVFALRPAPGAPPPPEGAQSLSISPQLIPNANALVKSLGIGLIACLAAAAALASPDVRARIADYVGAIGPNDAVRRAAHFPVASRLATIAPGIFGLAALAPAVLRPLRPVEAAAAAWAGAGAALLALHARPDVPYALAFWPGALVLAACVIARLSEGGARPLARPALAGFAGAFAVALVALDALGETGIAEGWLGDPYYFGPDRFARTFVLAAAAGGAAALVVRLFRGAAGAATGPWRPHPAIAAGVLAVHVASQAALLAPAVLMPERSLVAARADARAILPRGAVLGEHFAHALALGAPPSETGARYFMCGRSGPREAGTALDRGITHVAAAADRYAEAVRDRLTSPAGPPVEVASLYVRGTRVRVARLQGAGAAAPPPSAFELGRARFEADDMNGAAALFAAALAGAPRSDLLRAHLAAARALAGDLEGAEAALEGASRPSIQASLVRALVALRTGRPALAAGEIGPVRAAFRGWRALDAVAADLDAAIAAGDDAGVRALSGRRAELLVRDLLR